MYKLLMRQLMGKAPFIPESWPEDLWECMFQMANVGAKVEAQPLSIVHQDRDLELYTRTIDELFNRLEILIECVTHTEDQPKPWELELREIEPMSMAEYFFNHKVGYRAPQEVLQALVQKVAVLHYLIESKSIDSDHVYHPYLIRRFGFIAQDVCTVLEALIDLRVN